MPNETQLRRDVEFLAGRFPHRRANTENERAAAEFVRDRFAESTPNVNLDDFYSIDAASQLFGSYFAEFVVVALLAMLSPWAGAAWGTIVFVLFLGELSGFPLMSRFLPQYETQNVVARFLCPSPKRLLIVTANYDTPRATALTRPERAAWIRPAIVLSTVCMVLVIVTCFADALNVGGGAELPVTQWLRWFGALFLAGMALLIYLAQNGAEDTRGANNNASGVATLFSLAQSLSETPLRHTDVWLVATGAKENWMAGMQHLVREAELDAQQTYFLNIGPVGGGQLHYTKGEGLLAVFRSGKTLVRTAEKLATRHNAGPVIYRGLPTDAVIPKIYGYQAMSVIALEENGLPAQWNWTSDAATNIDVALLSRAAEFVEALVRDFDTQETK